MSSLHHCYIKGVSIIAVILLLNLAFLARLLGMLANGEVLPVEGNQGGLVGMRTSVDTSLKIAPEKIIHRIEMGLLEGHMLFVTTLLKCSCSQAMALGYITGCRLLLPHPGAISNYPPRSRGTVCSSTSRLMALLIPSLVSKM